MTKAKALRWLKIAGITGLVCWMTYLAGMLFIEGVVAGTVCRYEWATHENDVAASAAQAGISYTPAMDGCGP